MKKQMILGIGLALAVGCGGDPDDEEGARSALQPIWGPLQVVCPLQTGCVRGGYNFGDNWSFGSCPAGTLKRHTGVDLRAAAGTRVNAPAAGTVRLVYSAGSGWASAILIEHRDGANLPYVTQEMHVNATVRAGDRVVRGQQIGTVANIAVPHLHFGVWDGAYSTTGSTIYRGALPRTNCGGDVAFPSSFIDPRRYVQIN